MLSKYSPMRQYTTTYGKKLASLEESAVTCTCTEEWPELDRGGTWKIYLWRPPDHWSGHQARLCPQDYNSPAGWLPSHSGPTPIFSVIDRNIKTGKRQANPPASHVQSFAVTVPGDPGGSLRTTTRESRGFWVSKS